MELKDLNDEERLALVALLEVILDSDAEVSDEELAQLDAIAEEIGEELYEETADEVDRRFSDEEALRAFLPTIQRQEARELIFGELLETAISDSIDKGEGDLLSWLAAEWGIAVSSEKPPGES